MENQQMGIEEAIRLGQELTAFTKLPFDFPCRVSHFRDAVQSSAALAPFDSDGATSKALEIILHEYPDLESIYNLALQDYQDRYVQNPKISCRAGIVLNKVANQKCRRETQGDCEELSPEVIKCLPKMGE